MGMFYSNEEFTPMDESLKNPNELMEAFIVDEITHLPDNLIKEFCAPGGVGEQLVAEGKLRSKNTIVRMSKNDDLTRRKKMACLQLAKDHDDPNFKKLIVNRQRKNDLIDKIVARWGNKAEGIAKKSQNEFLRGGPKKKGILPAKFRKFGGEERISKDN